MTQDVSPFCQYSDLVVMVRVALQELRPPAAKRHKTAPLKDKRFFFIFVFLSVKSPLQLPQEGERKRE